MADDQMCDFLTNTEQELFFSKSSIAFLSNHIIKIREKIISQELAQWMPKELVDASQILTQLNNALTNSLYEGKRLPCKIYKIGLPVFKLAVEMKLESIVLQKETAKQLTHLEEPQQLLDEQLKIGENILKSEIFLNVQPAPTYSLSSYLNLETITRIQGDGAALAPRVFDDKFHVLMSQSLFLKDLRYYREQCLFRNRPVSVGYVDIDNFGKFNRELPGKETQVDKDILPRFMRALESFIFGRGFAYREGGDEYLVLLPSATYSEAKVFFEQLRRELESVVYPDGITGPTVSIGVCTASASERLTATQIQQFANNAKAFAKAGGRNRVAGYKENTDRSELSLLVFANR